MIARLTLALAVLAAGLLAAPAAEAQTFEVGRIRGQGGRVLERRIAEALVEAGLTAADDAPDLVISGRVRRRGRRYRLRLTVTRGADSSRVAASDRDPEALVADVVQQIRALAPADEPEPATEPAVEPEPEPAARPTEEPAPTEVAPSTGPSPLDSAQVALEVWAGGGGVGRAHSFRDNIFEQVGDWRIDAAAQLSARVRWFPLFHFSSDPTLGVGVEASVWSAVGLSTRLSSDAEGAVTYGTGLWEASLSVLYRLQLLEVLVLEPAFGYARSEFALAAPGPDQLDDRVEPVPDVTYDQLRPRLALELVLPEGFALRAEAAWLAVLGAGRLDDADWFPRSTTTGVELAASLRWRFDRWFAARLYFSHARFISALSPEPGDPRIAGGALDEWTRVGAELAFFVPGTP